LRPVIKRPPFGEYLTALWRRRRFITAFAVAKVHAEHSRNRLGQWWQVLDPVFTMAIYWFLFGVLLGGRGSVVNYVGFLAVGVFAFALIRQSINAGARSISGNIGLVRAIHFPRAALPVSAVLKQLRVFLVAFPIMIAILLLTREPLTLQWLLAVPAVLLMVLFSAGCALVAARAVAGVQDVGEVLPYFLRIWGYASGVMIPIADKFRSLDLPTPLIVASEINPGAVYLNIMRDALMGTYDAPLGAWNWLAAALWALVAAVFGIWFFWRAEATYGRG
jgi:teichoic acid transport system permease protein